MKRQYVGWIYETETLTVELSMPEPLGKVVKKFDRSNAGGTAARDYITEQIGDNWTLEQMPLTNLGCRIVLYKEEDETA